ncbi:MAG: hypothetical protein ACXVCY_12735 [Pseudobdellovibrionaceae bacterium]
MKKLGQFSALLLFVFTTQIAKAFPNDSTYLQNVLGGTFHLQQSIDIPALEAQYIFQGQPQKIYSSSEATEYFNSLRTRNERTQVKYCVIQAFWEVESRQGVRDSYGGLNPYEPYYQDLHLSKNVKFKLKSISAPKAGEGFYGQDLIIEGNKIQFVTPKISCFKVKVAINKNENSEDEFLPFFITVGEFNSIFENFILFDVSTAPVSIVLP